MWEAIALEMILAMFLWNAFARKEWNSMEIRDFKVSPIDQYFEVWNLANPL